MRQWLKPILLPFLRRDEGEVAEVARNFAIESDTGRELVDRLGRAFLGGYNAMLELESVELVADRGKHVSTHFRPFFFEGAAMGYLPVGMFNAGFRPERVERDLLGMAPRFVYLYYVGLGFWYGFRHPRRPDRMESLSPYIDALHFPLCYDGFGFKLAFFDYSRTRVLPPALARAPASRRSAIYQGFGRALHFVFMHDDTGFDAVRDQIPAEYRNDLDGGRALAFAFTGIDRPRDVLAFLAASDGEERLGARLTGVTWALAARVMNDEAYFESCLADLDPAQRTFFVDLPRLCEKAKGESGDYSDWQRRTRIPARGRYEELTGSPAG